MPKRARLSTVVASGRRRSRCPLRLPSGLCTNEMTVHAGGRKASSARATPGEGAVRTVVVVSPPAQRAPVREAAGCLCRCGVSSASFVRSIGLLRDAWPAPPSSELLDLVRCLDVLCPAHCRLWTIFPLCVYRRACIPYLAGCRVHMDRVVSVCIHLILGSSLMVVIRSAIRVYRCMRTPKGCPS